MVAKLSITLYIINYWTLSHIKCLKSHWISDTKNYFDGRMNNWYVLAQVGVVITKDLT